MRKKKLLTLQQLAEFCESNGLLKFSSSDTGYQLAVQVPATFDDVDDSDETMMFCTVKLMHTGTNRNGSALTEKAAKKLVKDGFAYVPVLANFTEDENGEPEFTSHDMAIDDDGRIVYLEKQVGCFTNAKPYIEENDGKNYIFAQAVIPTEYTRAAEIIRRKNGSKISAELGINEMSYDSKEKVLLLDDVVLMGATLLGVDPVTKAEIGEGMEGARIDEIKDFSQENNSPIAQYYTDVRLIETLEKLNATLSSFNIDDREGGVTMFDELLKRYNVTIDDVEFDYDGLSDEELEAKFEEVFGENKAEEDIDEAEVNDGEEIKEEFDGDSPSDDDDDDDDDETDVIDDDETSESKKIADSYMAESYAVITTDGRAMEFAVSMNDAIAALTELVNQTYAEGDNAWYNVIAFDNYIVMVDYWTGAAFRQSYKKRNDVYSLVGDRVSVKPVYLTEDEEKALDDIKAKFDSMYSELESYHEAEEIAKKEELIFSDGYASIFERAEYKDIDINSYSFDELSDKLDEILLKYAKEGNLNFSAVSNEEKPSITKKLFGQPEKKTRKSRYGGIFKNKE